MCERVWINDVQILMLSGTAYFHECAFKGMCRAQLSTSQTHKTCDSEFPAIISKTHSACEYAKYEDYFDQSRLSRICMPAGEQSVWRREEAEHIDEMHQLMAF